MYVHPAAHIWYRTPTLRFEDSWRESQGKDDDAGARVGNRRGRRAGPWTIQLPDIGEAVIDSSCSKVAASSSSMCGFASSLGWDGGGMGRSFQGSTNNRGRVRTGQFVKFRHDRLPSLAIAAGLIVGQALATAAASASHRVLSARIIGR
jgi:hypothetical protein